MSSSALEVSGSAVLPGEPVLPPFSPLEERSELAVLTDDAGAVGVVVVFVGVEKGGSDALDSFFLDCSASLARNSFCFASKEDTPSGVMSANAGARNKGVVMLKARIEGRQLELLIMRRANMVGEGESSECRVYR